MRTKRVTFIVGGLVLAALPCMGNAVKYLVETFDGPLAEASWRAGATDEIVTDGGNPGSFLHVPPVATIAPSIATKNLPGIWTGPYRFMGVVELGIDVELLGDALAKDDAALDAASDARSLSLELINEGDIRGDPTDDCIVVQVGKKLPKTGAGWRAYAFHVPSYVTSLPSGWAVRGSCGGRSPDEVWNRVMGFVDEARFTLGDPDAAYPVQLWDVGFDDPRLLVGKNRGTE